MLLPVHQERSLGVQSRVRIVLLLALQFVPLAYLVVLAFWQFLLENYRIQVQQALSEY